MILVPGQGNDYGDIYMQNQTRACIARGYHVLCIGPRGAQGIDKFTSILIRCPGRDSDIREVVDYVHSKYCSGDKTKNRQLFAMGYSIGANVLAKMIGIDKDKCKLTAAYCCQPPMKYWETIQNLKHNYYGILNLLIGCRLSVLYSPFKDYFYDFCLKKIKIDVY